MEMSKTGSAECEKNPQKKRKEREANTTVRSRKQYGSQQQEQNAAKPSK
jgi:hypothetical protein